MNRRLLAYLGILFTTVAWASSLIFAKIAYADSITPILFVALRYTLAVPVLLVLVPLLKKRDHIPFRVRDYWKPLLAVGITGPFLSQVLQYIGLSLTAASETLLLLNLSPVFAVLIAAPALGERVTRNKATGVTLAVLGTALIVFGGAPLDPVLGLGRLAGDSVIIVSTLLFAVNGIIGKMAVKSVDAVRVTLYSTVFVVPFLWVSAIGFEDVGVLLQISQTTWLIVTWVAVVNTAMAFVLYYESMRYIEASKVQIALNLIAVWGVIMSVTILGEPAFLGQLVGGALTILGVILAQQRASEADEESE
jgi:drug/metabolite transporter (DMT)-like permease